MRRAKIVKKVDLNDELVIPSVDGLIDSLLKAYSAKGTVEEKKYFRTVFPKVLRSEVSKKTVADQYNIIVLYDNTTLMKTDSDKIYSAISSLGASTKPILLVVVSYGGDLAGAYLIGKLCREFSKRLVVVVPRHAKSAATLLACAGDEIHMGSLSELGPIDPQMRMASGDRRPALGLKNAIEHIASLVSKNPDSGEMFAKYLKLSVEPIEIGYYERVAQSAEQYAEKLLSKHPGTLVSPAGEIAEKLVRSYKDHGFVIDKDEALSIFGDKMVKSGTLEYEIGDTIYNILSRAERIAEIFDHNFYFIGSLDDKPELIKRR